MDTTIKPFRIDIPRADLDDLQMRLANTRFPDELPGVEWTYGVPMAHVKPLVEYWRDGYDWRKWEAKLNQHPQFTTEIDGQTIHFLHIKSPEKNALPLILTHGWPMSVVEYLDVIGPLTNPSAHGGDPANAFDLVIPSIPGFGFSGPTHDKGWNRARIGQAWAALMARLGYDRYGAAGNDAGSQISPEVGRADPDHVVGVHVTQLFSFPTGDPKDFEGLTQQEVAALKRLKWFRDEMSGYSAIQSTQPQTLAYALADSPAGQLAWSSQLMAEVDRDYLLTNVSIYWLTRTANASARYYYEDVHVERPTGPINVPIGVAIFPQDFQSIRRYAERDYGKIGYWKEMARGGHNSAQDAPDLLIGSLREFFRGLR